MRIAPARRRIHAHALEQLDRRAIAAERADVDIVSAGFHRMRDAAVAEICVDKRAEIFVLPRALLPQPLQRVQGSARHLERAPDPVRARTCGLHLDHLYAAIRMRRYGIEDLRIADWKEQQREAIVRQ